MRATVRKWGNSAALRLPASMLADVGLAVDADVEVRTEQGRIVIEPIRTHGRSLDDLLAGVTDDNIHEEVDFGPPVGRELL
jgi:antitoxin MazE